MSESHDIQLFRCGMELLRWLERQIARRNAIPELPTDLMDIAVALLQRAAHIGPEHGVYPNHKEVRS